MTTTVQNLADTLINALKPQKFLLVVNFINANLESNESQTLMGLDCCGNQMTYNSHLVTKTL